MKNPIVAILGIAILLYPLICFASYVIHLKDGREFVTDQCYEEGDQIKFKRYGGVMGIQKGLVKEIEEIEEVEELPAKKEKTVEPEPAAAGAKTGKEEKTEEGAAKAAVPKHEGAEETKKTEEEESEKEKPVEVSEEEKKKAEQEMATKMETFLEERRQIMREMEIVDTRLKAANEENKKAEKRKWLMERTKLLNTLSELDNSVKSAHDGKLPDWWQNQL